MLEALAWTLALLPGGALLYFTGEVALGLQPLRRAGTPTGQEDFGVLAVLIPAHDEATVIGRTLAKLVQVVPAHARIFVVADNCSDDTAAIARACGVHG